MLGSFIRAQRQMANLSLRQLSAMADVSNPYLSQVERGMHEPSVRVLKSIADALNVSAETWLEQAGLISTDEDEDDGHRARDPGRPTADAGATTRTAERLPQLRRGQHRRALRVRTGAALISAQAM